MINRIFIPIVAGIAMMLGGFFFYQKGALKIEIDAPDTIVGGTEVTVNVTFTKGKLSNFARFQQDIPYGFTVKSENSANADFSFEDRKIRLIWLNLPDKSEFTASYIIIADERMSGNFDLGGTFSYVEGNARKSYDIAAKTISVIPSPNVAHSLVIDIGDFAKTATVAQAQTETSPSPPAAKPDETVQQAVAEKPLPPETQPNKSATEKESPVSEVAQPSQTTPVYVAATTESAPSQPVTTPELPVRIADPAHELNLMLSNENSVYYRVQIAAGHKPVNIVRYFGRHILNFEVKREQHEGWYKYSIGSFQEYRDARNCREQLNNTMLNGAFVSAYNNGRRITVQEALMMSHQQWVR
ncbi:MAG: hypothetical protein LBS09_03000 [Bacteroidales bacterium]|jgi:hypothetical protein|nr:hypothetical protein [Bacteroidales bacterium]